MVAPYCIAYQTAWKPLRQKHSFINIYTVSLTTADCSQLVTRKTGSVNTCTCKEVLKVSSPGTSRLFIFLYPLLKFLVLSQKLLEPIAFLTLLEKENFQSILVKHVLPYLVNDWLAHVPQVFHCRGSIFCCTQLVGMWGCPVRADVE